MGSNVVWCREWCEIELKAMLRKQNFVSVRGMKYGFLVGGYMIRTMVLEN